ncbi:FAD-binding oxidoreductase [Actinomadura rupiterrae]|uniref:FAD-binding oxidoreductase n=1 Tax=Actinomadura rupiterrae TaxID=559627 RepID=UPI0020A35293|nr:FAD-binding oxidoreductase [Actinomadura rupiterrae]MCP2340727.1 FAD/FMN-containing dehydrogenase [Actinomadura rupiterrae]
MTIPNFQGTVLTSADEGYDDARAAFQLAGWHRPDVVGVASSASDVAAAVRYAAERGMPVAVQNTGHGMPVPADGGLLINVSGLTGVAVDPGARTARAEAGARWRDVVREAAAHGLAGPNGSAPSVGVVSYLLGGGISILGRTAGHASDHVRAIEVVTADGTERRVTADSDPDLFWALRGGRANFGVVTAVELDLFPLERLYGGALYFDAEHVPAVFAAYREWTASVPDEMNSSIALVPLPDLPMVPEPLRGRHVAHIRIAYLGDADAGERLVAPLRGIAPRLVDSVRVMPYPEIGTIHNEPDVPMGYFTTHALVGDLPQTAVDELLRLTGPGGSDAPRIMEIRHLGGAMAKAPAVPSAVGHRDAAYFVAFLSPLVGGLTADDVRDFHDRLDAVVAPWKLGHALNFLYGANATPENVRAAYEPGDYERLVALKRAYDPSNLFRLNHNIPPA